MEMETLVVLVEVAQDLVAQQDQERQVREIMEALVILLLPIMVVVEAAAPAQLDLMEQLLPVEQAAPVYFLH
jgi:uncharacterized membrane protein